MNGQPIPGMYWVPEKQKYFAIQTGYAGREGNWSYSIQNVRKEGERDRSKKKAAVRTQKVRQERIVRRPVGALIQADIDRELGLRRPSFYQHQLWPAACLATMRSEPSFAIDGFDRIRCFDYDPASNTIYAVNGDNSVGKIEKVLRPADELSQPSSFGIPRGSRRRFERMMFADETVSSLNYLPSTRTLAITTQGSDRPPVVSFHDVERGVGQEFKVHGTIFSAAARPANFLPSQGLINSAAATVTEHVAVAGSNGMLLYTCSPTGNWHFERKVEPTKSDVLAVDWQSYSTVAFGCRNGSVYLHDARADGSAKILTHPYAISKIKLADDPTRLIVSGVHDSLFLYDIRSARLTPSSHYTEKYFEEQFPRKWDAAKRPRLNYEARWSWSQPVLSFSQHNPSDLELDIAVHPRLGLLAASQDSRNAFGVGIRVSNIWTGQTVKEIDMKPNNSEWKEPEKIRSLKFVDTENGKEGVELWSCWNGTIAQFTS
ncbi:hypothetical protein IQ07DRAFT_592103 [Pyrenochaeta sp. DS3sAY3a]|nr:hypothetical protein IQ07DRAFT_592103 [Pyrenochaeta sp. DS3sAY3a]